MKLWEFFRLAELFPGIENMTVVSLLFPKRERHEAAHSYLTVSVYRQICRLGKTDITESLMNWDNKHTLSIKIGHF